MRALALSISVLLAAAPAVHAQAPAPATAPAPTPAPAPEATPAPAPAATPPAPPSRRVVGLAEALQLAKRHQPSLRRAAAEVQAARARAAQSRAPLLPQVSASASYERATRNSNLRPTQDFDMGDSFGFGVSATQLVWDFDKTHGRYAAARQSVAAQEHSERAAEQDVAQAVRAAYFEARAARTLLAVSEETLANVQRHLEQISGFVAAGARAEIDLAQARTDLANARVDLISSQNGYDSARARLVQAVGGALVGDYDVADESMPVVAGEDGTTDALLARALPARAELHALERQIAAQERTADSIAGGYWPSLSVSTGVSEGGPALDDMRWNWRVGAALSWSLYQGGVTDAQRDEAQASLIALRAQLESQQQGIRLEIEEARLSLRAGKASLEATGEAVLGARERLRLAEGRYQAGVGSGLELADAQLGLSSALARQVQAEYALASARARLLRALGTE
jgi:outer membrane protein